MKSPLFLPLVFSINKPIKKEAKPKKEYLSSCIYMSDRIMSYDHREVLFNRINNELK